MIFFFFKFLLIIYVFGIEINQDEFKGGFNQKLLNEIHLYYSAQNLSLLVKKK